MSIRSLLLLFFSFLCGLNSYGFNTGQIKDSLPPDIFRESLLRQGFYQYDRLISPFSPFSLDTAQAGEFRMGLNPFGHIMKWDSPYAFRDTSKALTDISLLLGSKREQLLLVDHQQRISSRWSGALSYSSIVSPGFLLNSLTRFQKFKSEFTYSSRLFQSSFAFRLAKVEADDNGGVLPGQLSEGLSFSDYEQLQTNLQDDQRNIRDWFFNWKNEFAVLSRCSADSLVQSTLGFFIDSRYSRFGSSYSGPVNTAFYTSVFRDSLTTFDSSSVNLLRFSPGLSWRNSNGNRRYNFFFGMDYSLLDLKVDTLDANPTYLTPFAGFDFNTHGWRFFADVRYVAGNWLNAGDYSFKGGFSYYTKRKSLSLLEFDVNRHHILPEFTSIKYSSNYFRWNNDFVKEDFTGYAAVLHFFESKFTIRVGNSGWNNGVYYDSTASPVQSGRAAGLFYIESNAALSFGKFKAAGSLRYAKSGSDIIRVPELSSMIRLSFRDTFFNKALVAEFGTSVYGTSSYIGYGYMPATGVAFLQNSQTVGGAPVWDVFVNVVIGKNAVLSLIFQKLNNGLFGGENSLAANYPVPPRTLKFSLRWRLFN